MNHHYGYLKEFQAFSHQGTSNPNPNQVRVLPCLLPQNRYCLLIRHFQQAECRNSQWKNIPTLQRAPSWCNCWQNQWGCGDHSCGAEKEAEILHSPLLLHGLGLQKEQDSQKYPHLWPEETGYLLGAAKCADKKLLEESQLTNSTSLPLKPFSWPTCTSWFHFSLLEEWRTSWQIQAMCGTLPSWAAFQPARLWTVEPGLPAQWQA